MKELPNFQFGCDGVVDVKQKLQPITFVKQLLLKSGGFPVGPKFVQSNCHLLRGKLEKLKIALRVCADIESSQNHRSEILARSDERQNHADVYPVRAKNLLHTTPFLRIRTVDEKHA